MDELKFKHVYEDIVTTLFGTIILFFGGYYFWLHLKEITWEDIALALGIIAVGLLLVFGKIDTILKYLPGYKGEPPTPSDETNIPK